MKFIRVKFILRLFPADVIARLHSIHALLQANHELLSVDFASKKVLSGNFLNHECNFFYRIFFYKHFNFFTK
jgi:hypothetical protein